MKPYTSEAWYEILKNKPDSEKSLADHAEMWWYESGNQIPDRKTPEWMKMYKKWIDFAF
jgi:hypothetical protein